VEKELKSFDELIFTSELPDKIFRLS